MARSTKQGEWQAEAGEIFEQLLAANSAVNDAVILLAEGEHDKAIIAPVYDPARAIRLSVEEAVTDSRSVTIPHRETKGHGSLSRRTLGAPAYVPSVIGQLCHCSSPSAAPAQRGRDPGS